MSAQLAFATDFTRDTCDLARDRAQLTDHAIDGRSDAKEISANGLAVDLEGHLLREVALGDSDEDTRDLGGRSREVADQRVERVANRLPAAAQALHPHPFADLAVTTDDPREAGELERGVIQALGKIVEDLGHLAPDAVARPQANAEITAMQGLERRRQLRFRSRPRRRAEGAVR